MKAVSLLSILALVCAVLAIFICKMDGIATARDVFGGVTILFAAGTGLLAITWTTLRFIA